MNINALWQIDLYCILLQAERSPPVYREPKRKFALPWFFRLLGWFICLISILGGAFLVWGYGVTFGNDKTYQV